MTRRQEGPGRTTPKGTEAYDPFERPSLRQRSPLTFWTLMFLAFAMVSTPIFVLVELLL